MAADPRLCAPIRATPAIPAGANFVKAATVEEQVATALALDWVADVLDLVGELRGRAELARKGC